MDSLRVAYVVTEHYCAEEGCTVVGVFSSEQKAEAFIESEPVRSEFLHIEEHEIDNADRTRTVYIAHVDEDGREISRSEHMRRTTEFTEVRIVESYRMRPALERRAAEERTCLFRGESTESYEAALAAARDRLAER